MAQPEGPDRSPQAGSQATTSSSSSSSTSSTSPKPPSSPGNTQDGDRGGAVGVGVAANAAERGPSSSSGGDSGGIFSGSREYTGSSSPIVHYYTSPSTSYAWRFGQVFGERAPGEEVQEADIISAIEFDRSGNNLATGDRGGRVVLFERTEVPSKNLGMGGVGPTRQQLERQGSSLAQRGVEFRYSTEFQSHEPEFDYLKSLEIEEKINKIKWCEAGNGGRMLLSTNDKTIKLWRVYEKHVKYLTDFNVSSPGVFSTPLRSPGQPLPLPPHPLLRAGQLSIPRVQQAESVVTARCRRIYANAHAYHINSISTNSDRETFISADDLRVNLWHLSISDQSFNIVDIKPPNMEDLAEVITCAEFHPSHCNIFAYSTSKGTIRVADMRQAALCDKHAQVFEQQESPGSRSFFSEIIASVSDIRFCQTGRYLVSRDYMTVKLWDINMDSSPVETFKVHEHLRPKLCDLYENDFIFDKFECAVSYNGEMVATGSYDNTFRVFRTDIPNDEGLTLECTKNPMRKQQAAAAASGRLGRSNSGRGRRGGAAGNGGAHGQGAFGNGVAPGGSAAAAATAMDTENAGTKLLHLAWLPRGQVPMAACAASNSLYMFFASGSNDP